MPRSNYTGTKKTASDAAFYSGFASGFLSSVEGLFLFLTRKELRNLLSTSLKPLRNAQAAYVVVCILIFLLAREPTDSFWKLFWTCWRWGRMVTVLISVVLDRKRGVNAAMFFAALYIRDDQFGSSLEAKKPAKRSTLARLRKFKRIAKIAAIRGLAALVKFLMPSTNIILGPALKFASIRPVLGDKVAAAIAAIHLLPSTFLESTILDDVLASVAEAIVDAEDQGSDSTSEFYKRLDSDEVKEYFRERYRGYLTGSGFCNSLLMQIPFFGVPMTLISQCAAAVVVVDIVERNLQKENRLPFPCEDKLRTYSRGRSSDALKTIKDA